MEKRRISWRISASPSTETSQTVRASCGPIRRSSLAWPAATPADAVLLQQNDLEPALGQMQSGGAAGDTAADHADVGVNRALQRGALRARSHRCGVVGRHVARKTHGVPW